VGCGIQPGFGRGVDVGVQEPLELARIDQAVLGDVEGAHLLHRLKHPDEQAPTSTSKMT
jgi:hypothetical protein